MGVGGLRWCFVCSVGFWAMAPSSAEADTAPVAPAPPSSPNVGPAQAELPAASASSEPAPVDWRMPANAALGYSPFLNGTLGGIAIGERFSSSAYLGAEFGAFLGRWRISARTLFPFGVQQTTGEVLSNPEFLSIASQKPALLYGVSAGTAAYSSTGFVASIGLNFMRSDVGDFGNTLGLSLPLEWITRWGVRVGVEPGFLHAFGGEVLGECSTSVAPAFDPRDASCDAGEIRAFDRESGNGFWVHFLLGIPFDTPEPRPLGSLGKSG